MNRLDGENNKVMKAEQGFSGRRRHNDFKEVVRGLAVCLILGVLSVGSVVFAESRHVHEEVHHHGEHKHPVEHESTLYEGALNAKENHEVDILASNRPVAMLVAALLGEDFRIGVLVPAGQHAHDYRLQPSDIIKIHHRD